MQVESQKDVVFYEDQLTAVRADDGRVYVSVGQMCAALGLADRAQRRRLAEHDVLSEGLTQLPIQTAGGPQTVLMLRSDLVPLWLAGVQGRSTREDVRPKLKRFQIEAAKVLWEAFEDGRLTVTPNDDILSGVSPETVAAVKVAQAVLALARNQALMEQRLGGRLEALEGRLETVEAAMGRGDRYVTEDQASQISQAVKAVAMAFGKKSGRNEFGAVYGEMYRKFGISGYKMLPARRFEEAMRWLAEWHSEVTGEAGKAPF